jgi:hypothetical protein
MNRKPIYVILAALVALIGLVITLPARSQALTISLDQRASAVPLAQDFQDVPESSPFYSYLHNLVTQGIVSGYTCGGPGEPCVAPANLPYYRPGNSVTRLQMTKFIDLARHNGGINIDSTLLEPLVVTTRGDGGTAIHGRGGAHGKGVVGEVSALLSSGMLSPDQWEGTGVLGSSSLGNGVVGVTSAISQSGVYGSFTGSGFGYGIWGVSTGGPGVTGQSTNGNGVEGQSSAPSTYGVYGINRSYLQNQGSTGVFGEGAYGVTGIGHPIVADGQITFGYGVSGSCNGCANGVQGINYGTGNSGVGVWGQQHGSGVGVYGVANGTGAGVYGSSGTGGYAGYFTGNVRITGTCCGQAATTVEIDDPTDPANKYINQAGVVSPEMLDMLSGNATTDAQGDVMVQLPSYFQAMNRDFRYQLTVMGQFAQAIVSKEIANNQFSIKTDKPNVKVSWQITGVRNDPWAKDHPVQAEVPKPADKQGTYLYPQGYGQPETAGQDYNLIHLPTPTVPGK